MPRSSTRTQKPLPKGNEHPDSSSVHWHPLFLYFLYTDLRGGMLLWRASFAHLAHGFRSRVRAGRACEQQSRTLSPHVKALHTPRSGIPPLSNWVPMGAHEIILWSSNS